MSGVEGLLAGTLPRPGDWVLSAGHSEAAFPSLENPLGPSQCFSDCFVPVSTLALWKELSPAIGLPASQVGLQSQPHPPCLLPSLWLSLEAHLADAGHETLKYAIPRVGWLFSYQHKVERFLNPSPKRQVWIFRSTA